MQHAHTLLGAVCFCAVLNSTLHCHLPCCKAVDWVQQDSRLPCNLQTSSALLRCKKEQYFRSHPCRLPVSAFFTIPEAAGKASVTQAVTRHCQQHCCGCASILCQMVTRMQLKSSAEMVGGPVCKRQSRLGVHCQTSEDATFLPSAVAASPALLALLLDGLKMTAQSQIAKA